MKQFGAFFFFLLTFSSFSSSEVSSAAGGLILQDSVHVVETWGHYYDSKMTDDSLFFLNETRLGLNDSFRVASEISRDFKIMAQSIIDVAVMAKDSKNQEGLENIYKNIDLIEEVIDLWLGMYHAQDPRIFLTQHFKGDQVFIDDYLALFNQLVAYVDYINIGLKIEFLRIESLDSKFSEYLHQNPKNEEDQYYYLKTILHLFKSSLLELRSQFREGNFQEIIEEINKIFFPNREIILNRSLSNLS